MALAGAFTDAERDSLVRLFRAAPLRPRLGYCFKNALGIALAATRLLPEDGMAVEYGEGIGWSDSGAHPRAVMVLNGKAVDLTWRPLGRSGLLERAVWCQEHRRYFMRRVLVREAAEAVVNRRIWGIGMAERLYRRELQRGEAEDGGRGRILYRPGSLCP